jgi:hypothetical protein
LINVISQAPSSAFCSARQVPSEWVDVVEDARVLVEPPWIAAGNEDEIEKDHGPQRYRPAAENEQHHREVKIEAEAGEQVAPPALPALGQSSTGEGAVVAIAENRSCR